MSSMHTSKDRCGQRRPVRPAGKSRSQQLLAETLLSWKTTRVGSRSLPNSSSWTSRHHMSWALAFLIDSAGRAQCAARLELGNSCQDGHLCKRARKSEPADPTGPLSHAPRSASLMDGSQPLLAAMVVPQRGPSKNANGAAVRPPACCSHVQRRFHESLGAALGEEAAPNAGQWRAGVPASSPGCRGPAARIFFLRQMC
jgi:hypothetical protein